MDPFAEFTKFPRMQRAHNVCENAAILHPFNAYVYI